MAWGLKFPIVAGGGGGSTVDQTARDAASAANVLALGKTTLADVTAAVQTAGNAFRDAVLGAVSLMTIAREGALRKRDLRKLLGRILEPEDFGAVGDGTSHPLSESYATLAAAQVDYPAAIALTDEKDWCALRYWLESSGLRIGWALGSYVVNIPDLAHVLRGQSDQWLYFGGSSKITVNGVWSLPAVAWCEKRNVHIDGLRLRTTAVFASTSANNNAFTPAQFNTTVGPIWTAGQSYRNIAGLLSINGTDNFTLQNFSIEHSTPARKNNIFMSISLSFHTNGTPSENVKIQDGYLNDYIFGIFGYGRHLKLRSLRTRRYDQTQVDIWASGHLIYLSNYLYGGMGNSEVEIDDIYAAGEFLGTDTAAFTCDTAADTITFDYEGEYPVGQNYAPSNMANGVSVFFMGGAPPAPLVLERAYYVKNYNAATRTFQLMAYGGNAAAPAIDLTSAPGAGCRMGCESALGTIGARYSHGIKVSNVRSFCAHGTLISHNCVGVRASNITHNSETFPGLFVSTSAQGGVFDSGVPVANSMMVGRYVRVITGAGAGQKRRIITQEGGENFSVAANAFTVDSPWTVQPAAGDAYEVGNPYQGLAPPIYGVAAFKSQAHDDSVFDSITVTGDLGSKAAVFFAGRDSAGTMRSKRLVISRLRLDLDVSRSYGAYPIYFGAEDVEVDAKVALKGPWPLAECGMFYAETGTKGSVDIKFTGSLVASRIEPISGNDLDIMLRDRRGTPISYSIQGSRLATVAGYRMRSEPQERLLQTIQATAASGSFSVPNFDRLEVPGTYELVLDIHDASYTNHTSVKFVVRYTTGGASVLKEASRVLSGTAITTADVSLASGVLSATLTMASAATVTMGSYWRRVG